MNPLYAHLLAIAIVVAATFVQWRRRKKLRREHKEQAKIFQIKEIDEPFSRVSDFGRN
jgi:preprotein translocase subunit YajC